MVRILVAEDDAALGRIVCRALSGAGFETVHCADGESALFLLREENFDMLVCDVMMPKMDGFALAAAVREEDRHLPILFMTALGDKASKQRGYSLLIDDYVEKPFDTDILVLRIRALLRRSNIEKNRQLTAGNLRMDAEEHTAYVNGEELPLTVREFDLLFKLLSFPRRTFTRNQLMEEFWDFDSSATSRTVDVYMSKLREKTAVCDGFEIVTVHGLGYKAVLK